MQHNFLQIFVVALQYAVQCRNMGLAEASVYPVMQKILEMLV